MMVIGVWGGKGCTRCERRGCEGCEWCERCERCEGYRRRVLECESCLSPPLTHARLGLGVIACTPLSEYGNPPRPGLSVIVYSPFLIRQPIALPFLIWQPASRAGCRGRARRGRRAQQRARATRVGPTGVQAGGRRGLIRGERAEIAPISSRDGVEIESRWS